MKNILMSIIFILSVTALFSCNIGAGSTGVNEHLDTTPNDSVRMTARIDEIGEKITVTVLESEYTTGIHWVITHEQTKYTSENGATTSRDDLQVGDTVEIFYNGQVMMSYPPQIVAWKIVKK